MSIAILFAYSTGGVFASGKPGWGSWSTEKGPHTVRFDGSLSDSLYGIVKYGTTIQMEREAKSKTKNKTQSVLLQNLQPNTVYYYILGVEDDNGVRTMAETADTFTTTAEGKPEIPEKEVYPAGTIPVGITIKLPGPSYTPINELESSTLKMPNINRVDLTVNSDSARATCSITSAASKDDWVASQIEYGLAADKQPFQEQFNWGFRESWCKREALLKGLPSNSSIFFRIFAAYRKYDGVDIQAYSRPVSFQTPEKGGAAVSLSFTDIDAPRIIDTLLVREARSAVLSFKTTRPASVWGSYSKQPAINGEYQEVDGVIPRGSLSLTHRFVFEDLKEDSVYPLELWVEDEKGAGIRLTFNMQTRPLDPTLDTQDSNKFQFDSTRQSLRPVPGKTPPYEERTIPKGSPVKLSWESSGSGCEARGAWSGAKPAKGSAVITPQETGTYEMRCIVNGIERRKSISLTVVDPPDFTFTVSKGELAADGKLPIALEWDASFMETCFASNKGAYFEQLPKTWTATPLALKGSERFFAANYSMEFSLECTWHSAPYAKRVSIPATSKPGSSASAQSTSTPAKEPKVTASSTSTPPTQFQSSTPTELPPGAFPPPHFYNFSFPPGTFPPLPETAQPPFSRPAFGSLGGSIQQGDQPKTLNPKKVSTTKTKNGSNAPATKKKPVLTFTATKYKVKPKEKFTLSWNAPGYTSCLLLSGEGDIISDAMKQKGSLTLTQADTTVDYLLQCFKKKKYVSKKITITLSKP
ncbi:hypothetical protein HY622_04125 [Candidatus Uhrbacteria bacterium]|nr:hypothetical protein [Candidatus Uhrbacteria bacterium]